MSLTVFKRDERCQSIAQCVEIAVKTGKHDAFADYFLDDKKTKFKIDFFSTEYSKMLNYDDKLVQKCEVMHSNFWRNSNFYKGNKNYIIIHGNGKLLKGHKIKDANKVNVLRILMRKKSVLINNSDNGAVNKEKNTKRVYIVHRVFYGKESKYKWFNGKAMPDKDALVQIGLYLGWGYEEVNKLLILSGNRQLYALDIIDAIGMYYLELFKDEKNIEPNDKLEIVKNEINKRVKQLGNRVINVSTKPVGCNINEEIKELKEKHNIIGELSDTYILTSYVNTELNNAINKNNFNVFFENVKNIVATKQYGYLRRTLQYIEEIKSYQKNLFYTEDTYVRNLSKEEILEMLENGEKYKIWNLDENILSIGIDEKLKIINGIWKLKSINNIDKPKSVPRDKVFVVNNLIKGRTKQFSPVDVQPEDDPYIICNDDELILMKFAIAVGKEEQIGEYLIRSGHREENLNDMISYADDKEYVWEKTDSLLIYSLCYRDKLIEIWSKKFDEKSRTIFIKSAKDKFSMINLLMNICEVIQTDIRFEKKQKDYYKGKVSALLYPVNDER